MIKCTVSGIAVLDDGTKIPYKAYVGIDCAPHPHWTKVKNARIEFDHHMCVVCHKQVDKDFQTHHLTYERLGHERLRDVITLCNECHKNFHEVWMYAEYYKKQDENHWTTFSLEDTAKLCAGYLHEDYWFGGDLDCCNPPVCQDLIDNYFKDNQLTVPAVISPEDVQLYFRNKRYEVLFRAERNGLVLNKTVDSVGDAFLDERFGTKGGKGGNQNRSKARSFMIRHDHESFHRNYWYLWHINILIEEAKKYEQTEQL